MLATCQLSGLFSQWGPSYRSKLNEYEQATSKLMHAAYHTLILKQIYGIGYSVDMQTNSQPAHNYHQYQIS